MRRRPCVPGLLAIFLCCSVAASAAALAADAPRHRPTVGAIRWDGWNAWAFYEKCFDPPEWRYRLPFFATVTKDNQARVREDSREVMDREIAYAKASGLDYWAFLYYHPEGWPPHSADMYRCLELYLSNPAREDIHYCLILSGGPHLGPKDKLPQTTQFLVQRFKDPSYQRVLNGRPLVYFFEIADLVTTMGSEEAARDWLRHLREASLSAGAGDPYLVVMAFWPPKGAEQADQLGCDAISAYTGHVNGAPVENKGFSYARLAERNREHWERGKKTGKPFIPTVNAGWDFRPMKRPEFPDRDLMADWFEAPKPEELADHLEAGMRWVEEHPTACPGRSVLIYAWNELSEGGWLVPTLSEGTARLDAIGQMLQAYEARPE